MTTTVARSRYLPKLSIDALTYSRASLSSLSSLSSSTRASFAPSYSTMSTESDGSFFVCCVFDFDSQDPDQLSFRRDEILQVIRTEESGWWAAVREGDNRVGWIPSSYVELLSYDGDTETETQSFEDTSSRDSYFPSDAASPLSITHQYQTSPMSTSRCQWQENVVEKPLPPPPYELPDETSPSQSASLPYDPAGDPTSPGQEITFYPQDTAKPYPPSPAIPLPPTPKTAPLQADTIERKRSLPFPITPLVRAESYPMTADPSASFQARYVRRRPLLIDEQSISRLSVLLETRSAKEIDGMASPLSPSDNMNPSMLGGRSPVPRPGKIWQLTGDDEAQSLHSARAALASRPWFLQPIHGEDHIKTEFDGSVVSGTLPALVERLTSQPLSYSVDRAFRRSFLLTFRTLGTANEIFDLLLDRYYMDAPEGITMAELEDWKVRCLLPTQRRVLEVFTAWLVEHAMVEDDPPIARRLQDFLAEIPSSAENVGLAQQVMKTLERLTFAVPVMEYPNTKPHKRRKTKDFKNELLKMDPTALAEHLCIYEHMLYAKIRPRECLDWIKFRNGEPVANLLSFCTLHDKLAAWVKQSVLWTDHLGQRADVIDFWIKVAEKCRIMHNYSSMSAIVTALSCAALQRLHLTWAHVGKTSQLSSLSQLNDPTGRFSAYRQAQHDTDAPCVPFIGMYLTDILHINDHYKDTSIDTGGSSERMFSFIKRRRWSDTIDTILAHQSKRYPYSQDPVTMQYIESNLALAAGIKPAAFWSQSLDVQQSERARADIRKGLEAAGF